MLLVLLGFALPGTVSLSWIADAPWFGIDHSVHSKIAWLGR